MQLGDKLPSLTVTSINSEKLKLNTPAFKNVVIYFYPKDNTPGCTQESKDFRDKEAKFAKLGFKILGVSRDSIKSHQKFIDKHELNFDLIADTDEAMCSLFDVVKDKNMFGKKVRGIVRSTFLFHKGKLVKEWRKVKVLDHVNEVLAAIKELN